MRYKTFIFSGLILTLFMLSSCAKWFEDNTQNDPLLVSSSNSSAFGAMRVSESSGAVYSHSMHLLGENNAKTECSVSAIDGGNVSTSENILCWVEVEENDLFYVGVQFTLDIAAGNCDYIGYQPFSFYQYQPGRTVETYFSVSCGCDSGCVEIAGVPPPCQYDYSVTGGPNCDTGSIMHNTKAWSEDSDTNSCVLVSDTNSTSLCGGDFDACINGPVTDLGVKEQIVFIDNGEYSNTWEISSPNSKGLFTNKYIANYAQFCAENDTEFDAIEYSNYAKYRAPGNEPVLDPLRKSPFYYFTCYDKALDVKARIRVMVREWDTEFDSSNAYVEQSGPVAQMDSDALEQEDLGPFNDYSDWDNARVDGANPTCTSDTDQGFIFPTGGL